MFQTKVELEFYFIYCHRNPADFFHSFYAQFYWYFKQIIELNTFVKYVAYGCSEPVGRLGFTLIGRKEIVQIVKDVFSSDHILQINYESFVQDPVSFIDKISNFLMLKKHDFVVDFSIRHNSRKSGSNDALRLGDTYPHWIPRKSPSFTFIVITCLQAIYNKILGRDTENIKVEIELTKGLRDMFCKRIQE
jgi:hypothetical protein